MPEFLFATRDMMRRQSLVLMLLWVLRLPLLTSATLWTSLPRSEHPDGVPIKTSSPIEALTLAKRDGASLLTGVDTEDSSALFETVLAMFDDDKENETKLVAAQAPMHVGTNNFGFRAGKPLT